MKRCRHVISMDSIKHRCDVVADGHRGPTATGRGCMQWKTCAKCHAWLPLGPARDDERTAVEVRAAELCWDISGASFTDKEWCGYNGDEVYRKSAGGPLLHFDLTDPQWQAGYLSAVIDAHEEPKP